MFNYFKEYTAFCKSFILAILLISPSAFARINQIETTRMMSTAGSGVGSVLMDEASILNPASLAFFNLSSIYFQKGSSNTTSDSVGNSKADADQTSFIASDSSGSLSGSIGYFKQSNNLNEQRKTWSFAAASPLGKSSSFGMSYQMQTEVLQVPGGIEEKKYKMSNAGFFHAINQNFSFGLLATDIFGNKTNNSKAFLGMQYVYDNMMSFMLDVGSIYKEDLAKNSIIKAAVQIKFFNDFYLRFGAKEDKSERLRGNGIGVGWVQPKLVIDLALSNNKFQTEAASDSEKVSSFSLAYKF
ncbi:MAG: hypothetical protein COW00_05645 [Bdellovibrio sp. CG12_big_fil_rev_8_21_14_0_65_39_13]|nr:MAG: hypothetical protein COW78_18180 [Bdellovibrio sp. CG22_combo_CG10-13_8_21_14_all_39_27]PIQ60714.1 MAG: hypothetical protein COW00_05645 [Bdellovibrio sp. CG12_big_fil_rev_8_21_14_0_65_39_13]PIR36338.1 MAG: hypothetical protein COV37_02980 [Bdellovibrio sp. CG11_big_fil_rev_8_21_14_0_20_39_38]